MVTTFLEFLETRKDQGTLVGKFDCGSSTKCRCAVVEMQSQLYGHVLRSSYNLLLFLL